MRDGPQPQQPGYEALRLTKDVFEPSQSPEPHEDLALASRCCAGDAAAFEALYRAHAPRLYGLACRMVDRREADDLLQDIFLAAHRKLASFKGESSLATWLFRLATNLCIDHLRSRGAQFARRSHTLEDEAISTSTQAGPLPSIIDRLALERALTTLSPGCRAVFVLHDVEGLEHQEVAQSLGISSGTSKSQLHKARRRLRAVLAPGPAPAAGQRCSGGAGTR